MKISMGKRMRSLHISFQASILRKIGGEPETSQREQQELRKVARCCMMVLIVTRLATEVRQTQLPQ